MELIEIVDKNGNFTGQVMDKEEAHDGLSTVWIDYNKSDRKDKDMIK